MRYCSYINYSTKILQEMLIKAKINIICMYNGVGVNILGFKLINYFQEEFMTTNKDQKSMPSPVQSRASSSSSSQSQNYELIPKEDTFFHPQRDLPSPKASFPFKKVQSAYQSLLNNKQNNQSNQEQNNIIVAEVSAKDSIQPIIETKVDDNTSKNKQTIQNQQQTDNYSISREQLKENKVFDSNHQKRLEQQLATIQQKQQIIIQLQAQIQQQRLSNELQRKANQIYAQGFAKIRQLLQHKIGQQLKGEAIQELVQKLSDILNTKGGESSIIEEMQEKIRDLREQLLKSSQNNINAIFNTQITESHCLQLQIKKMNSQITTLRQNIMKVTSENQYYMNRMSNHKFKHNRDNQKIDKIYQYQTNMLESQQDQRQLHKNTKKPNSKNQKRQSRESSSSSGRKRNKRFVSTQSKIGELIEGYKLLRDQYKILQTAIRQMSGSQTDFRELFTILRTEITGSIKNQIRQVNQSLKRPSSNHEQLKIAKDLEFKLNHLVNTLNAPEKVNIQIPLDEDTRNDWKNVESIRKIAELQSHAAQVEKQVRELEKQKLCLEQAISTLTTIYQGQRKQHIKKSYENKKLYQYEQSLVFSRPPPKDKQMEQRISSAQNELEPCINKSHGCRSRHDRSKRSQLENLYEKLQTYEDFTRQKQHRISELQNAIIDHIQSKASPSFVPSVNQLKQKYDLYINNLKMLLAEARRQNQFIKRQLFKATQMGLDRVNATIIDQNTINQRNTKNRIVNDSSILKKTNKPNNFESIKAKIQIEDTLEKAFLVLLELAQKITIYKQIQRISLGEAVYNCLKEVILQSRQRRTVLYQQTLQNQQIRNKLISIKLYSN